MENIFSITTLIIIIIGAVVGIIQLKLLRKQIKAQHDWNRRSSSFQFSLHKDPSITEIISKLDECFGINCNRPCEIKIEEIEDCKDDNPTAPSYIHFVLGHFEDLCVAMKSSVVDEIVCKEMLGTKLCNYYRFFNSYIEHVRIETRCVTLYKNLEFYARKWESERIPFEERTPTDK